MAGVVEVMSSRSLVLEARKTRDRQRNQKCPGEPRPNQHRTTIIFAYHIPKNVAPGGYLDSIRSHL
jgi:hypothetical protein